MCKSKVFFRGDRRRFLFDEPGGAAPGGRLPIVFPFFRGNPRRQRLIEIISKGVELRNMYEPYLYALADYLNQSLPPWIPAKKGKDNWQTTAWGRSAGLVEKEAAAIASEEHF